MAAHSGRGRTRRRNRPSWQGSHSRWQAGHVASQIEPIACSGGDIPAAISRRVRRRSSHRSVRGTAPGAPLDALIPALDAAEQLAPTLASLEPGWALDLACKVILIDGGSTDEAAEPSCIAGSGLGKVCT